MADKPKKQTLGASVPPPTEKADFLSQLQNTFERGVVSAEVDLGALFNEKGGGGSVVTMFGEAARISTGPAGVQDQIFKKMKTIANTFGGKFTVHAPMQANPSEILEVGRAKAVGILKQSLNYTEKLGGSVLTVHPIGQMENYFIDPFVGTKIPLPNPFFLAKNEGELKELMGKLRVKDPLLKQQIKKEWENFIGTLPITFAERYGALAVQDMSAFAEGVSNIHAIRLLKKYGKDPAKFKNEANNLLRKLNPHVGAAFSRITNSLIKNGTLDQKVLVETLQKEEYSKRIADHLWERVSMTSLDPLDKEGLRPSSNEQAREFRVKAWEKVLSKGERGGTRRFGPFKDSEEEILNSVRETFKHLFEGIKKEKSSVYNAMKNKKLKIGIENIFPASPEHGQMQGYAYFYRPEHMAKIIKMLRKEAEKQGLPKDTITMTFDIGHAAASGIKPSDFLKELKKKGIKPGHVHIVGGPGYGPSHIAWGDWLDEVSRMDPNIVSKLTEVGAINIEGGAGLHDIDVTLNALWDKGLPLEAMLAMSGSDSFTLGLEKYSGFEFSPYMQGVAKSYVGTGLPQRAFYSFQQETTPMPMQNAFSGYTAPALVGGGYTIGPGRTSAIWASSQPTLYSSKNENG